MNPSLIIDLSTQYSHDGKMSKMDSTMSISLRLFLFGLINSNNIVANDNISIRNWLSVGTEKSDPVAAFGVSIEIEIKEVTAAFT